jgi:cellulose synthase/poly-beta-1,6-N-acetylglucosamine synthase-like glycosyltransferase
MMETFLFALWGLWLFMILFAAGRVVAFPMLRRWQDRRWGKPAPRQDATALIVAAKGFDLKATPAFFDTLFTQDYPDYRVIICFETWQDPVACWLAEQFDLNPDTPVWHHPEAGANLRSVTLVGAGTTTNEGQKVHNQRAAFDLLEDGDRIVAFADADILCSHDWLTRLVAPLNHGTHPISTTYRWLVPQRPTSANQFASVINASIATQGGSEHTNVLWGGSMALTRHVFDTLQVPELLRGALNDDLRLSKAARTAGFTIAFVRSIILPTDIDFTWKTFLEFAKRQYTQVKIFSPILYTGVNLLLGLYLVGFLSVIGAIIYGYFPAWIPLAAAYVIDQVRAIARQQVILSLFPSDVIRRRLFSLSWLEHMLTPVWMLLHWAIVASTWTQRHIVWAGIHYEIISKEKTKVLGRADQIIPLPAGAPGLPFLLALGDKAATAPLTTLRVEPAVIPATVGIEAVTPVAAAAAFVPAPATEASPEPEPLVAAEHTEAAEPAIPPAAEPAPPIEVFAAADAAQEGETASPDLTAPDLSSATRFASPTLALWAEPSIIDTAPSLQLWSRPPSKDPARFLITSRKGERAHPLSPRQTSLPATARTSPHRSDRAPVSPATPPPSAPTPSTIPLPTGHETSRASPTSLGNYPPTPRTLAARRPQRGFILTPQLPSPALSSRPRPAARSQPPGGLTYRVARPTSRKPSARPH